MIDLKDPANAKSVPRHRFKARFAMLGAFAIVLCVGVGGVIGLTKPASSALAQQTYDDGVYYGLAFQTTAEVEHAAHLLARAGLQFERQPGNVIVAFSDLGDEEAPATPQMAELRVRQIAAAVGGEYLGRGGMTQID